MYNNKTITLINCCDGKFESVRKVCSETAIQVGKADRVIEYSPDMIDDEFKKKNKELLSVKRGAGLWIWKPYFILKALESIPENHYLIYLDAGVIVVNEFRYLIESLEKSQQDVMAFGLPLLNKEWTKKEVITAILPGVDENINQILGGYIVIKNTEFSRNVIQDWLTHMQDPVCILPQNVTGEDNYWNFIENRDDQSVWTLICRKHNIVPFRDPSQYGEYPYFYAWLPKYKDMWRKYSFCPQKYDNSPYPQIVSSNRLNDPKETLKKERKFRLLDSLGLLKIIYKIKFNPFLSVVERNEQD